MARPLRNPTRFGDQPARQLLKAERYSMREAALITGCPIPHTTRALRGDIRPHPLLIERLSNLLRREPSDLFTEEVLSRPYWSQPERGWADR